MATVLVLASRASGGQRRYAQAWRKGRGSPASRFKRLWSQEYREPCTEILLHYGFDGSQESEIARAFNDYVRAGLKAVYVDLGYFKNRHGERGGRALGRYGDYHRFSINARHPTAHFQRVKHPPDRAEALGIKLAKKMRQGENIILCGMSPKASVFDDVIGWEEAAIVKIRKATARPIVYRPKPQRVETGSIAALARHELQRSDLDVRSRTSSIDAWAVVSHHSNAGLDALVAGVPCFQPEGVASVLGLADLSLNRRRLGFPRSRSGSSSSTTSAIRSSMGARPRPA